MSYSSTVCLAVIIDLTRKLSSIEFPGVGGFDSSSGEGKVDKMSGYELYFPVVVLGRPGQSSQVVGESIRLGWDTGAGQEVGCGRSAPTARPETVVRPHSTVSTILKAPVFSGKDLVSVDRHWLKVLFFTWDPKREIRVHIDESFTLYRTIFVYRGFPLCFSWYLEPVKPQKKLEGLYTNSYWKFSSPRWLVKTTLLEPVLLSRVPDLPPRVVPSSRIGGVTRPFQWLQIEVTKMNVLFV